MGIYAPDGSWNIILDTAGSGIYSPDGYYRCTSSTTPPGIYENDGSYRVVFGSSGQGVLDASGSLRMSTASGTGIYDETGAIRVTITNEEAPSAIVLHPISTANKAGESNISSLGGGSYFVETYGDDYAIRFSFDLASLVPGQSYQVNFTISDSTDTILVDVCDDSPEHGPYSNGDVSFTFSRPSYTSTYRFIDVYPEHPDDEEGQSFTISNITLTAL